MKVVLNKALFKAGGGFHLTTVQKAKQNLPTNNNKIKANPPCFSVCGPVPLGSSASLHVGQDGKGCSCIRSWTPDVTYCAVRQVVQLIVQGSGNLPTHPPLLSFQAHVAWSWVTMCYYSIINMDTQPAKQSLLCLARGGAEMFGFHYSKMLKGVAS